MNVDVVIIGSGAGGLATAVAAAHLGLKVAVVEKEAHFGGTTAWSGGWMWLPRNKFALKEPIEAPLTYLKNELGNHFNEELARTFLENAPKAVDFFLENSSLEFIDGNAIPDFHESEGFAKGGRSLCAKPFDGRELGALIHDLKRPLLAVSPFGMGIAAGAEFRHFLNATYKWASFKFTAKQVAKHFLDLGLHGRGMRLVNGNALVARLLKSANDKGVILIKNEAALELLKTGDKVTGVKTTTLTIEAKAVVLAAGGFPHDPKRFESEHFSAAPKTNIGEGLTLGEQAGGVMKQEMVANAAYAPVSLVPSNNGYIHFPHLIERAKPGLMMVLPNGKRFTNEANSYYDVVKDLLPHGDKCFAICDKAFIDKYGLGRVRPRPFPKGTWVANGYLKTGKTLQKLAKICGIESLEKTVADYNAYAKTGIDEEFNRGSTAYNKIQGDFENAPNPCLKPLEKAPFYAVEIRIGSLGTFQGLETNADGQVLNTHKTPIEGLYAAGNDRASMMGGHYPSGGITLGPALVFGYLTAQKIKGLR